MSTPAHRLARIACLAATCALVACGGGGGGSDDAGSPAPPSPPPPAPAAASTCGLPDFTAAAMARINQHRAAGADCGTRGTYAPAPALAWNTQLTQAADVHSRDMQANNFFSHTGSNGSTFSQRIDAAGYDWRSAGENIAAGQSSINAVVDGWIDSDGHCANLMNPSFEHVGLACVSGTSSNTYRTYWTMELARPR
jgi:uncharacterized protein YkwD